MSDATDDDENAEFNRRLERLGRQEKAKADLLIAVAEEVKDLLFAQALAKDSDDLHDRSSKLGALIDALMETYL